MSNYNYGGQNPFDQRGGGGGGGGYNQPPAGGYSQGGGDYNQGGGGGYGQQQQQQGGYAQQPQQPQGGYGGGGGGGYVQGGGSSGMEMSSSGGAIGILNECRNIDDGIKQLESQHQQLRTLHDRSTYEVDHNPDSRTQLEITSILEDIRDGYGNLHDRLKNIATKPESQSPKCKPQVDRVKRALKDSVQSFTTLRSELGREKDDELRRQYRNAHGDVPQAQVEDFVDRVNSGEDAQVYQQALMQSNRLGNANRTLSALKDRNLALQKIERKMAELLELFQDMDTLVMQQDVAVAQIEQKAEEVVVNLDKGNEQIGVAVETAKATRRKKWWCLAICVAIVVVIAVIVVIVGAVNGWFSGGGDDTPAPAAAVTDNTPAATATPAAAKRSLLSAQIRGGPLHLVTARDVPVVRVHARNFVPTSFTDEETLGGADSFDLGRRDNGPLLEKIAKMTLRV